ncbi:MAG: hypothetical protein IJD60_02865 [Clostridia bacterium]|nr:hypothetical protein [Clostridia bacterium]
MRRAIKIAKPIQAFRLGDHSQMEQTLIDEGTIRITPTGYELMSLEAINGHGEFAVVGDYFKVNTTADGKHFAYPNGKEWFETHHKHLGGNNYLQINQPVFFWQAGDPMNEEIKWLLDKGKLFLCKEDEERYFNANLWGTHLSAARDATLIFYEIKRDSEGISEISFNFIKKEVFQATYEILQG